MHARKSIGPLLGLAYGAVLGALGMLAAGAGHGTSMPLMLFMSPAVALGWATPVVGEVVGGGLVAAGMTLQWAAIGAVAQRSASPRAARAFQVLIASHYAVGVIAVLRVGDWSYVAPVAPIVLPAIVVYAAGQAALWRAHLDARRRAT